jgi:hypothetical protein
MTRSKLTRRAASILAAGALAPIGWAGLASAATVNGCPSGDVCTYTAGTSTPSGSPVSLGGSSLLATLGLKPNGIVVVFDNTTLTSSNSGAAYISEGNYEPEFFGLACAYVPDPKDLQAPGQWQAVNSAGDGTAVTVMQFGATAAQADATTYVSPGNC